MIFSDIRQNDGDIVQKDSLIRKRKPRCSHDVTSDKFPRIFGGFLRGSVSQMNTNGSEQHRMQTV